MESPPRPSTFDESPLGTDSPEMWERLIQALGPASMLVCIEERLSSTLANFVTADDVWQETLLHVWRDRATCEWRGITAFRHWVLAVAENRMRNLADRVHSLKRGDGAPLVRLDDTAVGGPPPVHTTTPSEIARHSERASVMRSALSSLPDDVREVVRLRLFEELGVAEVAGRLELGESAVKHRFRKGAALYQSELERLFGGEGLSP